MPGSSNDQGATGDPGGSWIGRVVGGHRIVGTLGSGGAGVVYEAKRPDGGRVALKTIKNADPQRLYRFKKEFRALAELRHRNIVELHELVIEDEGAYFTMELVEGVDILDYVRQGLTQRELPNLDRARRAFRQLVEGLRRLHETGQVHRDIKPSNVMVNGEGRVVILDFGLVRNDLAIELDTVTQQLGGTPAYMAPEQALDRPLSEATDFYAVGLVLYEALTGARPFPGRGVAGLFARQTQKATPPVEIVPGLPVELDRLCCRLLEREPEARPNAEEILEVLGGDSISVRSASPAGRGGHGHFVGRADELARLHACAMEVLAGTTVMVDLRGRSGIGKSRLVKQFLRELRTAGEPVVLRGRCFDRESMPYKGVDELIDALSHFLQSLPPTEAAGLLPRHVDSLTELFPVLLRVEVVEEASRRIKRAPDPEERRRLAISALRELLSRIGDRWLLVLSLDDVQWTDRDSAGLLGDLLEGAEPPTMLLLASCREEFVGHSGPLDELLELPVPRRESLQLGPLDEATARELAESLLGPHDGLDELVVAGQGSPFYLEQLASFGAAAMDSLGKEDPDAVVQRRVQRLDAEEQGLLALVCAAGGPMAARLCLAAAEGETDANQILAQLEDRGLVKRSQRADDAMVEPAHDRIRETVVANLSDEARRSLHARLASLLEHEAEPDVEALTGHFHRAGNLSRAADYAELAAGQAARAVAFDRALHLYRLAISIRGDDASLELRRNYADALAHAGHGQRAADEYQALVPLAGTEDSRALQIRASAELLRIGQTRSGLMVMTEPLAALRMPMPNRRWKNIASLVLRRIGIFLRGGLRFRERPAVSIDAGTLERIDTAWAVANGLIGVDSLKGADYQTRHLALALRAGEPYRVGRALALEALFVSQSPRRGLERCIALAERAQDLAERTGEQHINGLAKLSMGAGHMFVRRWRASLETCESASSVLAECSGVNWELTTARQLVFSCLYHLGEFPTLQRELPGFLSRAAERGDVYAGIQVATLTSLARVIRDDGDGARSALDQYLGPWEVDGFQVPHLSGMLTRIAVEVYRDRPDLAVDYCDRKWSLARRSLLMQVEFLRTTALDHRGRALVALAATSPGDTRARALARARADVRSMGRRNGAGALADTILAGAAAVEGDTRAAARLFEAAARAFDERGMQVHAASVRFQRGRLIGGAEGEAARLQASELMSERGVGSPAQFAWMLAPAARA